MFLPPQIGTQCLLNSNSSHPFPLIPGNRYFTFFFYGFDYLGTMYKWNCVTHIILCHDYNSEYCFRDPSMLQYLLEFPFFLRLSSISILHIYPQLFTHLSIDTVIISDFCLLWIILLWILTSKYLFYPCFHFFWIYT